MAFKRFFHRIIFLVVFAKPLLSQGEGLIISNPSKLFNLPAADVLRSAEICISGGSAFGRENRLKLIQNVTLGLGGIAEAEISTTGMTNKLTGESESYAMSSFKLNLIPEKYQRLWFMPNLTLALKSSSWKTLNNQTGQIRPEYLVRSSLSDENLTALYVKNRFSVLYFIAGKRWKFGGVHVGASMTDVRVKEGYRSYYMYNAEGQFQSYCSAIPEVQKEYIMPVAGIEMTANKKTWILAEIQSVPIFDFDVYRQNVIISQSWLGVAGIRFSITEWFTLDAGVKYQSNNMGIADSEIRIGGNCMIPVNHFLTKIGQPHENQTGK